MKFIRFDVGIVRLSVRRLILTSSIILMASCGGSGSGGGGDDDDVVAARFPTPTLPAGAVKIDAANAAEIANTVLEFTGILFEFPFALKTEGPPSISQAIKLVTDGISKRNRNLGSVVAGKTEDVSAIFCDTGTAIDTFTETSDGTSESISGEIVFTNCDLDDDPDPGRVLLLDGTFPYDASSNGVTLDFDFHFGGTLAFSDGIDTINLVLNFTESGNDGTGVFTLIPSFSLDGIPGGGYLVTTVQSLMGSFFDPVTLTDGELNVEGADDTQLCMTVTAPNEVTVKLDEGFGGGCIVDLAPFPLVIFL
jgi:hypothetical protein